MLGEDGIHSRVITRRQGFRRDHVRGRVENAYQHRDTKTHGNEPNSPGHTEESFGYETLAGCRRFVSPHPDPLPRGDGTAGARLVVSRWSLSKLRYGCDREAVDCSPSPQGSGPG